MQSLASMLTSSTFRKPDLTPEQWAENDAMVERMEAEERAREALRRLQSADIPRGYMDARITDERVAEWASSPTKGLFLNGGVGRGKTHNACAVLVDAVGKGMSAKFVTFDDVLRECRASFQNLDTERAIIGRYANVGMLCIDDMGKERVTEWSLPIVFAVINKRSMNDKPTIVTTQYTGRQLVERMTVNGDSETARAIVSRFFEYTRITLEGKDWRRGNQ